jgi:hypothetical protein
MLRLRILQPEISSRVRFSYHLMPASGDNPIEPLDPPLMQR